MKTRATQTSTQSSCRPAFFFSTCNGARSDVSLVAKGPRHFSRNLLLQLFCIWCHEKQLSPRYTPHSALYTLHPTTPHYTPLHPALHTLHSTHSTRSALYTPHCTLYSPHSALRTLHNTLYSRACRAICALTPLDAALAMRFATNTQHDTPKVLPVTQNDDGGLQSAAPAANYCACHTKRLSALLQTRASVPRLPRKTTIQPVLTPSKQKKLLQLPP